MDDINIALVLAGVFYWVIAFTESDGPFDIFEWLREARFIGGLFSCYICLSVWVAGLMFLFALYLPPLLVISAIAGAFVLVYRAGVMIGNLVEAVKLDHQVDTIHRIMCQMESHTTFTQDIRNAMVREMLTGNFDTSLEEAINDWGYLVEDEDAK